VTQAFDCRTAGLVNFELEVNNPPPQLFRSQRVYSSIIPGISQCFHDPVVSPDQLFGSLSASPEN